MVTNEEFGRKLAKQMSENGIDGKSTGFEPPDQGSDECSLSRSEGTPGTPRPPDPPEGECGLDRPYLEENPDLFSLLLGSKDGLSVCPRLIRHVNSCYRCFEIYAGVLRGFTLARSGVNPRTEKGSD
jgi:hypothetical protein